MDITGTARRGGLSEQISLTTACGKSVPILLLTLNLSKLGDKGTLIHDHHILLVATDEFYTLLLCTRETKENSLRPLTTPLRRAFFHPLFSSHSDRLHVARNNGKSVMQEWSTRTVTLVLGLGVIAVSSASILVRWNTEASGLTIAFYRMAWASVLLFPLYLRDRNSNPD